MANQRLSLGKMLTFEGLLRCANAFKQQKQPKLGKPKETRQIVGGSSAAQQN